MGLEALLRLAHPFLPFITEELWQNLQHIVASDPVATDRATVSIMQRPYPDGEVTATHAKMDHSNSSHSSELLPSLAVRTAAMLRDEIAESQMATLHGVVGAARSLQARVASILPPLKEQAIEMLVIEGTEASEQHTAELFGLLQRYSHALKQRCRVGSISVRRTSDCSGLTMVRCIGLVLTVPGVF